MKDYLEMLRSKIGHCEALVKVWSDEVRNKATSLAMDQLDKCQKSLAYWEKKYRVSSGETRKYDVGVILKDSSGRYKIVELKPNLGVSVAYETKKGGWSKSVRIIRIEDFDDYVIVD